MKHIEGILYRVYCKIRFKYGKHLAIIACPGNEPLHFHHDGCPACEYYEDMEELAKEGEGGVPCKMPDDIILDLAKTLELVATHCNCNDGTAETVGLNWSYLHKLDNRTQHWLGKVYGEAMPPSLKYSYGEAKQDSLVDADSDQYKYIKEQELLDMLDDTEKLELEKHIPPPDMFATEKDMEEIRHYGWSIVRTIRAMDGNNDNWREEENVRECISHILELFDTIQEARKYQKKWTSNPWESEV